MCYPSELRKLISDSTSSCSELFFADQSLVSFVEHRNREQPFPNDPSNVKGILSFERNFGGQLYMQQDLDDSGHCTFSTHDAQRLLNIKFDMQGSVPFLHVPKSMNYISPDKKILVLNNDSDFSEAGAEDPLKSNGILEKSQVMITKMFQHGLAEIFEYDSKKRSSASSSSKSKKVKKVAKKSKSTTLKKVVRSNFTGSSKHPIAIDKNALPVITLGWSTLDCNQYGANMSTVAGTIKPFLRDANVPKRASKILIELIEMITEWLPGEWAFNIDKNGDEEVIQLRTEMIADFKELLGGDRDISNFRVEGITILIPLSIGFHKDTLNCSSEGMRSVISINCKIPMNDKTIPSGPNSKLWLWLVANGYTSFFPCSIILYSRKAVYSICNKMSMSHAFAKKDLTRKCVKWVLIDRVGTVTDYRSRIWNNSSFPSLFKKHSTKKKGSRFKGLLWTSPAAYDKMVS